MIGTVIDCLAVLLLLMAVVVGMAVAAVAFIVLANPEEFDGEE